MLYSALLSVDCDGGVRRLEATKRKIHLIGRAAEFVCTHIGRLTAARGREKYKEKGVGFDACPRVVLGFTLLPALGWNIDMRMI